MSSRAALAEQFRTAGKDPWKTFVVEAHTSNGQAHAFLKDIVGETGVIKPSEDRFLYELKAQRDVQFWVDTLEERFWSFHTVSGSGDAGRYLKNRVERHRTLDFAWLPSGHLQHAWPGSRMGKLATSFRGQELLPEEYHLRGFGIAVTGQDSDRILADLLGGRDRYASLASFGRVVLRIVDGEFGTADEAVDRMGRFVAHGDSFELHQELVRAIVGRYAGLVEAIEDRRLGIDAFDEGGWRPHGSPLLLQFSRPVPDMPKFLDGLFSCREPFRLWGSPRELADGVFEVEAVDLHVGERISFEISANWLRVYLHDGACGNTVARLVANLQHGFDARVRFADPDLQSALELKGEDGDPPGTVAASSTTSER